MRNTIIGIVVIMSVALFVLVYPNVYVVKGSAGGSLLWNTHEALLFIGVARSGAHMAYPRYLFEPVLVRLGDVRPPDDSNCIESFAIRITDDRVQNYQTDVGCASYEVFDSHIYADQWPRLSKWVGTHFERPTAEEYGAFATFKFGGGVSQHPWEFDSVDGWSMRVLNQTPPKYQFALNGQNVSISYSGPSWPPRPISVELIRSDQPPQELWSFDGRSNRVSKAEYQRIFVSR